MRKPRPSQPQVPRRSWHPRSPSSARTAPRPRFTCARAGSSPFTSPASAGSPTFRAGDGWAAAVISPKVLGCPGSSGTGDTGDGTRESWGPVTVEACEPYTAGPPFQPVAPPEFTAPVRRVVKSVHWDWTDGQVESEVQRIWTGMLAADPPS